MSIYYWIPQIEREQLISDLKAGRIQGLRLVYRDFHGNVVDENEGYPTIVEESTGAVAWIKHPPYSRGVGIKFYGLNVCSERINAVFERLRAYYRHVTPISEDQLGILHVG